MTENAETPRVLAGASQKNLAAGGGGGLEAIVSHPLPKAQQAELFHVDEATALYPIARPLPLATRGRTEYGVRCPKCGQMHRHVHLGLVDRAPCGARYYVQPKRGRGRRAA
ncbi:hypothetical protein PV733_07360 [Streptomyces europaeiscabiei]|jgi:hypothetical protein|uniref:hypothetical protein n=1 Tax=Streptomyces europaeiscabiei TaxID=146819 RepID=UPI0029A55A81|nr:hypothetical protein [Streptomyces europaeiscabiei]MDX3708792.1 hypothetical protein [Streptomyces europaeiscabiei]